MHPSPPRPRVVFSALPVAAALLAGAMAALWWPQRLPWLCHALALGAAGLLTGYAWRSGRGAWPAAVLAGFGWAGLHAGWALEAQLPAHREGREALVQGRIEGLPDPGPRHTRFQLRVDDAPTQPAALRGALLQLSWYDDFDAVRIGPRAGLRAGAPWRMRVRLRAPRGLVNPGGFDAERYALAHRVAARGLVRAPAAAAALGPPRGVDAWREAMSERIARTLARPSAAYVQALALGDTRGLQDRDWETLRATGLTHLIAISGFHVGLVAGFCALLAGGVWRLLPRLGRGLPRTQAAAMAAVLGAAGYAVLAGLSLPTVRTVLMIAVVALARLLRRRTGTAQSLALALLAVLLFDPLSVLLAGFWLSFAGVAWLVWCLPVHGAPLLRGFLSAQWVATIGLLPLTVVMFGQASLVGPLANLVAIPWWTLVVVPLSLLGTGLEALRAGAGGWAWHAAAACFDLTWPGFDRLGHGRFALWWLPESGGLALVLALLGAFWLLLPRGTPGKPLALALWLPMLWPERELPGPGEVELQVFDVGQGLAVLVRTHRHALLYDAGPAVRDGFDAGERVVVPALRASGQARLDAVVISHADMDHAGGHAAVRAVVPVGTTYAPPSSPLPADRRCSPARGWAWDGVRFRFLHPDVHFPYLRNESSCVLRIETAQGALLLPGDIGEVVERRLARDRPDALRADVVVAPHHGSAGSSQPAFVQAAGARLVLISAGYGNRFGHPRAEVVARWRGAGAEVLDTATSGALRVWLGRGGLQVRERRVWRSRLWDAQERRRAAAILSGSRQSAAAPEG